jgi:hypothetical protein
MTNAIKQVIANSGLLICPTCNGEGEIGYFCGHETTSTCYDCQGNGIVKSLNKQKQRYSCRICNGRGGPGCCDNKGFREFETWELIN